MIRIRSTLLAFFATSLIHGLVTNTANAQIQKFQPELAHDSYPKICTSFLNAWRDVFTSNQPLTEQYVDLSKAFPQAAIWSFPHKNKGGLYNSSYMFSIDFDGDSNREVLFLDSNDLGWRYLGANLYLFENEEKFREQSFYPTMQPLETDSEVLYRRGDLHFNSCEAGASEGCKTVAEYRRANAVHVLKIDKDVFTVSIVQGPSENESRSVDLLKLNAPKDSAAICTVNLLPPRSTLTDFRNRSQLFKNLSDVYGGRVGCQGTMGWRRPEVDAHLSGIFYRPHLLLNYKDKLYGNRAYPNQDASREVRFLAWGVSDPQSWRDYLDLKAGRNAFLTEMRTHYETQFDYAPEDGQVLAEQAWRALLDSVVYARNPDSHSLTRVAVFDSELPISPTTEPSEIVRLVLEAWLSKKSDGDSIFRNGNATIWKQALLAAVYTRQPMTAIEAVFTRFDAFFEGRLDNASDEKYRSSLLQTRQATLNAAFLAALGDVSLTDYFIDKGADPNTGTNWFGKTALMYAAQQNQSQATKYLLNKGVNVNAITDGSQYGCHQLKRDSRTALMYAAENASVDLIDQLLSAGANVSVEDSQGNTALWYFQRNIAITDPRQRQGVEKALVH